MTLKKSTVTKYRTIVTL